MVVLKSKAEIEIMRQAGRIVAETLDEVEQVIRPGLTTAEIDRVVEKAIRSRGATPSFKGLYDFPASACISVNEEIVHGLPGKRMLREGDIVTVDCGAYYRGLHADGAWTFPVGKVNERTQRLLDVTHDALMRGIAAIHPDARTLDLAQTVQEYVEGQGMNLLRDMTWHGVGRNLHETPDIPNWLEPNGKRPRNYRLKPGLTFAIEPMVIAGGWETYIKPDKWTVATADKSWSAHFEHTVVVTDKGCEILTRA
jgi:methionyl aminopeptidase